MQADPMAWALVRYSMRFLRLLVRTPRLTHGSSTHITLHRHLINRAGLGFTLLILLTSEFRD